MKKLTSLEHPLVKHWVRLKNNSRYRKTEQRVLVEGKNCIADLTKKIPIKRLIATHECPAIAAEEFFLVSNAIFKKISGVDEKEGIIAEVLIRNMCSQVPIKRLLVCDRIQDPGNLGTLIRSACALGWNAVFLLHGTCDPFNDKALRASKGASFSISLLSGSWHELLSLCQKNALSLVVADVNGEPLDKKSSTGGIALVLANEGQGPQIGPEIAHKKVTIAMENDVESLNVAQAGAIFLYEFGTKGQK